MDLCIGILVNKKFKFPVCIPAFEMLHIGPLILYIFFALDKWSWLIYINLYRMDNPVL